MPVNSELVTRLLHPIRDDAPAGDDLRYDPRVDAIKEARREDLDLPTNNAEVKRKLADWTLVVELTTGLLADATKDLQLAAWLTEALLRRDGYAGLATGLAVVHQLLDGFWDTLHPRPEDGDDEIRIGPLEWIGAKLPIPLRLVPFGAAGVSLVQIDESRLIPSERDAESSRELQESRQAALAQGKPSPESVAQALAALSKGALRTMLADLDAARNGVAAVDRVADARFGRLAPSLVDLRNAIDDIRRLASSLLARRLEEDPDPIVSEDGEEQTPPGTPEREVASSEPASRADALARIGAAARWLRAQEPGNPASYLLLRGVRWGELCADAPSLDPRLLEAPPTALRARLKALLLDARWPELLEQAELVMATPAGRGWLDLQRYVLTACAQLGAPYDAVAAAIRRTLRGTLRAVPQLSRMTLMDDTPTANEETRAWLAAEGLDGDELTATESGTIVSGAIISTDAQPDGEPAAFGDATVDVLAEALEDDRGAAQQGGFSRHRPVRRREPRGRDPFELACGELAQNRPHRAIELLMAEVARDASPRGRLVRHTQVAYVMVEAGLDGVAQPLLQRIIDTIDERQLEQWESGPLVAQPLALMCRVLERTGGDDGLRQELYLRVCRLDPLQALLLRGR